LWHQREFRGKQPIAGIFDRQFGAGDTMAAAANALDSPIYQVRLEAV
jgi:hypothetical protein